MLLPREELGHAHAVNTWSGSSKKWKVDGLNEDNLWCSRAKTGDSTNSMNN